MLSKISQVSGMAITVHIDLTYWLQNLFYLFVVLIVASCLQKPNGVVKQNCKYNTDMHGLCVMI